MNNEYETDQTPLAAHLMTAGFTLKDMYFVGNFAHFIFDNDSKRLEDCVKDFELLRAEANASILIRNYQDLIKRIKRGF